MDVYPTRDGYVCVVRYGPQSDWVRNSIEAGAASLRIEGEDRDLTHPRLIDQEEAFGQLIDGLEVPKSFTTTDLYLLFDLAS